MTGLDVEAVLRDHYLYINMRDRGCNCGARYHDTPRTREALDDVHRAHVAEILRGALADAWDAGYGDGHDDEANARYDLGGNPYRASLAATEGDRQ